MKNNKGFTLVEILAAVTILGILAGISIAAYSKYVGQSKDKSRKILAESSANAAEEYFMDHPDKTSVYLDELVEEEYLESDRDPQDNSSKCKGKVTKTKTGGSGGKLVDIKYTVVLCCIRHNYTYTFPEPEDKNYKPTKNSSCGI